MPSQFKKPNFSDTKTAFEYYSSRKLFQSYLLFKGLSSQGLSRIGADLISQGLKWRLPLRPLVRATIYGHFCGGETLAECKDVVDGLASFGVDSLLDYAVEGYESSDGLDQTFAAILDAADFAGRSQRVPYVVFKPSALFLNEDLRGLPPSDSTAYTSGPLKKGMDRALGICERALKYNLGVLIDAEQSWFQDRIDDIALFLMKRFNKRGKILVYNTVQTYRKDRDDYLRNLLLASEQGNFKVGIKLVRGAYLETERARAAEAGKPSPLWKTKSETDACFDRCAELILEHHDRVAMVAGTHNEASVQKLVRKMAGLKMEKADASCYFSQLYGMSDNLSFVLAKSGYKVAKYVPYGPIEATMPYLARRAQENSSVRGQTSRELSLITKELKRRGLLPGL